MHPSYIDISTKKYRFRLKRKAREMLQSQNTATIDHVLDNQTIIKYSYNRSQSVKSRHTTRIPTEQNTHISIPPLTLDPYDGPGRN